MRYSLIGILGIAAVFAACSQTVSASSDDEVISLASSSSKKGKSSSSKDSGKISSSSTEKQAGSSSSNKPNDEKLSSSSVAEELDENCVGEPGNPWDGTTAKDFACGAGTKKSPYIILTAEQLAHLSFVVGSNDGNYAGKYYKLGADIKLNKDDIIDDKGALVGDSTKLHKWTPIGNSSVAFTGYFDGDGHTVSGMFINTTSSNNGLFGNSSGTVQNVTLDNSWVYGGKYTGGVIGYVGTVENVTNFASVSGIEDCVGGVLGSSNQRQYQYNSILKKLKNNGVIVGKKNVGGVSGCATYVDVDGAENTAPIEGYGYVGGVFGGIGSSSKNDIKDVRNSGEITGIHFVGGVSGHCGGTSLNINTYQETSSYYCSNATYWPCGKFSQAVNLAPIVGRYYVGGVLGVACGGLINELANVGNVEGVYGTAGVVGSAAYVTSKNIYNRGNVFGELYAGGIFSYNQEGVTSSVYSTGKVDGDSLVGLMIGYNYNTTMADYYYLEQGEQEPFGLNNSGGVATPKSTDEMKSDKFAELLGDEFIYDSGLNDGYPVLSWEKE